jgi:hypothetical protein
MKSELVCITALTLLASTAFASTSAMQSAPSDPRAVTVKGKGDGKADDTDAIQHALDEASEHGGVVFLPAGRYKISKSLLIWPAVRLFGTGRTRPVLVLADNTPGFQKGVGSMVVFTGAPRGVIAHNDMGRVEVTRVPFPPPTVVPFDPKIADANPNTFYSVLSNVDIRIGAGNPAATGVRFRVAQHSYLSNMDFELGSGFAGIYQAGNVVHNLHFHGGRYGIVTEKTSPAWQFTAVDCLFDGQKSAAIREHEADLTLVNASIRNVPVGIDIDRGYGDSMFGKDVRFENVRQAAVVISNENNVFTQIGFSNALARNTPVFAKFRDSGRTVDGKGSAYRVGSFSYGLTVPAAGQVGHFDTSAEMEAVRSWPAPKPLAIRGLPPVAQWANAHDLGVIGDGEADDTAAIQRAIDSHRVVYLPLGAYKVSDTIHLKKDSVLIALHPALTQIVLADGTPNYQGVGGPRAVVQSAEGGDAIVSGVGLYTGGVNVRAVALLWTAGENSLVDDVKFELARNMSPASAMRFNKFNSNRWGAPDPAQRWDGQYPSLWVTNGGGGTFNGIWSPDTFASAGLFVSNTTTPGHVYEISVEHHVRNEIVLDRVANWEFLAPQTEEEFRESLNCVSFEIRDSHDILIANYHGYRVTRTVGPFPAAARLYAARDIHFRNVHVNGESGIATCDGDDCTTFLRLTKYPYENSIQDMTSGLEVREREFARLDFAGSAPGAAVAGSAVKKLAGGFEGLGGGALDSHGTLYFVDRILPRIFSWTQAQGLKIVSSAPLDPVNLAVDRSDDLLVLSSDGNEGSVYSLKPNGLDAAITRIEAEPAGTHADAAIALPVIWWVNGEFKDQYDPATDQFPTLAELFQRDVTASQRREYSSPDGSVVLPAFRVIHQGTPDYRGFRFSHTLDTYGFTKAKPGSHIYVSSGAEGRTYGATVGPDGSLKDLSVFVERGGESVATDAAGRVYVANGQVFVYGPNKEPLQVIEVPERPLQLLVSGQTLFILSHHSLYSVGLGG